MSELEVRITIVLGIYFAAMGAIALAVHLLTKKYNDK